MLGLRSTNLLLQHLPSKITQPEGVALRLLADGFLQLKYDSFVCEAQNNESPAVVISSLGSDSYNDAVLK